MHRLISAWILVPALVLGIAGCQQPQQSQQPSQPASGSAPTEIKIGVNAPLTGMFAGFGEGGVFGEQAAVDDLNKQGGIMVKEFGKKLPVRLVIRDNESDANKSGSLEEDLILREKVHFTSPPNQPLPLVIAQANLADRYKIPRVSGGNPMEGWLELRNQASPKWEYSWTYGFAIVSPPAKGSYWDKPGFTIMDTWVAMLDKYAAQTNKTVAVFASDEPDGRAWYSLFPKALKDMGYKVVGVDKNLGLLPMETTDFTSTVNEWKSGGAEILWGNSPAPFFGTMWKQANALGFQPKMASIGRAPLFYTDVAAWGGNLPNGIGVEIWWDTTWKDSPGIGGTTPQSLTDRWVQAKKQPLNPSIGWGYQGIQILADAIERAGTLDGPAVNAALAKTEMKTIAQYVKFDEQHHARSPLVYGQWRKSTKAGQDWELPIVFSKHENIPTAADPIFPIPYR